MQHGSCGRCAEIPGEPLKLSAMTIGDVVTLAEAMWFARIDHGTHRHMVIAQRAIQLVRLADRHDGILGAMDDQRRRRDARRIRDG